MSSLLEIIELIDGEIVLQRADGETEPLLTLNFSAEARQYIGTARLEVARAMIQAGIEAVSDIQLQEIEEARERLHSESQDAGRDAQQDQDEATDEAGTKAKRTLAVSASAGKVSDDSDSARSQKEASRENELRRFKEGRDDSEDSRELGAIKSSDLSSSRVLH